MTTLVENLLDELDSSRESFLVAIELLPDEALQQPGVMGSWSVADVLVNLTVWEAELVTAMLKLDQGAKPAALLAALADPAAYDQQRYAENVGRELDRVFDDLMKVRLELEEWLEMFSERKLGNKMQFRSLNGRSIAELVQEIIIDREARFLPSVALFARRWELNQLGSIPLTAVSVEETPDE